MNTMTAPSIQSPVARGPRRILLVYPEIPSGTYWSYSYALKIIGKKSNLPPLGLLTVAGMIPDECEVRLVDLNVQALEAMDLEWADVVFVSAMIVQKESFETVIDRAGQAGVPVVAGGPYPSSDYENLSGVDHLVVGEAEPLFGEFWADLVRGEAKRVYARVLSGDEEDRLRSCFGEDADIRRVEERPAMSEVPVPRFELLEQSAYRAMSVQTSRGCPIGCEFCDIWRRFGRKPRCKPGAQLLEELDALYDAGWRNSVFVVDDNFIGNKKLAKQLLREIAAWQRAHRYPFDFFTEATLTMADDEELLGLFREAGFDMVFIGIETPSADSLAETGKHINTSGSMVDRVRKIQSAGIQVTAGFIIGFDQDPEDIADRMIECIAELGIPSAMVGILIPLPETDLYERLQREGRLRERTSGNNTHDFRVIFKTKRPEEAVIADYKKILRTIYPEDLGSFFRRCATLRNRWMANPVPARVTWFSIRALLGCLWEMPWHRYRWHAFRFLFGTLLKKPAFFATAVGLCIQGHHFRQITRNAFEVAHLESWFSEKRKAFADRMQALTAHAEPGELHPDRLESLCQMRDEILAEAAVRVRRVSRDARVTVEKRYDEFATELEAMYLQISMVGLCPIEV